MGMFNELLTNLASKCDSSYPKRGPTGEANVVQQALFTRYKRYAKTQPGTGGNIDRIGLLAT